MKKITTQVADNLEVVIIPSADHEFLMTSKEVATAYGITQSNLRNYISSNDHDLIEGKHFVKGARIMDTLGKGAQPHQTFWTKRGIVRLGFFIKSERAKIFRDWAEDLVIEQLENRNTKQVIQELPQTPKRKHNRLTVERVNDIMKYVCLIEDKSLRMIITDKLYQQ
ncbi:BRO family protein [Flavobacterium oreochromis]|uniref:BRO family protein n=1 Tax=Flavobacterium oreochromis TaxID=2906078 RepID=UPI00385CC2A3